MKKYIVTDPYKNKQTGDKTNRSSVLKAPSLMVTKWFLQNLRVQCWSSPSLTEGTDTEYPLAPAKTASVGRDPKGIFRKAQAVFSQKSFTVNN